ncbi:MAG TPA: AAA domain-containing protein [Gemmataceae bacterium]|nr:AAA domain-containing protein [Gemmataceae bacterium]
MSRRVRHTTGTAEEAQPAGSRTGTADSVAPSWNACFHGFSADDRARILALALPTGIVYAQQLPDPKSAGKNDDRLPSLFAPFLNGHVKQLESGEQRPLAFLDNELDRWQKEAVSKALATPDLFLLRGHPGSGKSRVLLEVIRQAVGRGDRVLFISRHSPGLDRILSALAATGDSLAVRLPQPGENEDLLRPEIRAALLERRVADLVARARSTGQMDQAACRQEAQEFERALANRPALVDLLGQRIKLDECRRAFESKRTTAAQELAAFADSQDSTATGGDFAQAWSSWTKEAASKQAAHDSTILDLERSVEEIKTKLAQLQAENRRLSPLLHARARGRFWTPAWWSALLKPAETRRAGEVAEHLLNASSELGRQETALASAIADRQRQTDETALERTRLLDIERARRESTLAAESAELAAQNVQLSQRWHDLCQRLPALANTSLASLHDLDQARLQWEEGRARAQAAKLRAEQWLDLLDQHPHSLRDAIVEHTPLIAATAAGWAADRGLAARLSSKPFDLLVLEEAEQFAEPECASFARLARRWLFVGSDYLLDHHLAAPTLGSTENPDAVPLRQPVLFGQLWQRLHSNPEHLPYAWVQDGDKLLCRLRPILSEQRRWIETERLADHPQIVLHILALPRSRPVVAEVVFPAAFTIQNAKQFILQELQELAVHAPARSLRWHDEHADRLVLQLTDRACHHHAAVTLAPGIKEMLNPRRTKESDPEGVAWQTCCIEFERHTGWKRRTAEEWIERHLGLRDLGRTLYLDGLPRFSASLRPFLETLIGLQSHGGSSSAADVLPFEDIEFVAVPPMAEVTRGERGGPGPRMRTAGLELDMNEPKHRERLPADLRAGLPAHGFVNLSEAQAIIRRLLECERAGSLPSAAHGETTVFVIALYEAQAELIRRLLRATPPLAARGPSIEVGRPDAFAHRDASWVLLSVTRSHSHRATAFGAGPGELLLALSRARNKLLIFGDAGALGRRAQWEGTVEQLDALQANQERDLVRTLLAAFQNTPHLRTASVGSEGSGT